MIIWVKVASFEASQALQFLVSSNVSVDHSWAAGRVHDPLNGLSRRFGHLGRAGGPQANESGTELGGYAVVQLLELGGRSAADK